jgi:carbonic anhydrase
MDILRPKYEEVADLPDPLEQERQLEKHAVMASLENLMTFPWIEDRVKLGELTIHGLWTDIGEGGLECYSPETKRFEPV